MVRVAPIKLQYSQKTLWFDPQDFELYKGDGVVVKTARGVEFGRMADDIREVTEAEVKKLKGGLKPVWRLAGPQDEAAAEAMQEKSDAALSVFKEMAAEASGDMRPVSVEYLLEGDKAVFFFEAEERIDFRDLVRRLAAHFHVRVDMRQIGVRDEARMVGGLGHCGQELCCKRMGGEFCPVSIRMAKEQDLSLNPQKISGVCGRLMCCLRYEFEAYKEFKQRAPKAGALIDTAEGKAKVVELDMPREIISLRLPEGKTVKIPLAEFDQPEGGGRPTSVSAEVLDTYLNATMAIALGTPSSITPNFSGTDKLADASERRPSAPRQRAGSGQKGRKGAPETDKARKPRRSRRSGDGDEGAVEGAAKNKKAEGRSGLAKKRTGQRPAKQKGNSTRPGQQDAAKSFSGRASGSPRPGQNASGLKREQPPRSGRSGGLEGGQHPGAGEGTHRRARRRSHRAGSSEGAGGADAAQ